MTVTTEQLTERVDPHDQVDLAIGEVAEITGISAHTLRYYERIGLVKVGRDTSGRRVYDSAALARVVFVTRLRMSDMPIREITRYLALVNQGETTVPARLALMQAHRAAIRTRLADLQAALSVIDHKIAMYGHPPHSAGSAGYQAAE